MIKLRPLLKNSYLCRTPIDIKYTDVSPTVEITTTLSDGKIDKDVLLKFNTVAEVNIRTLYFPEAYYKEYVILDNGEECGFYEVIDFENKKMKMYDPKGNLNLKLFLVYGYDSYVEILCSDYKIIDV